MKFVSGRHLVDRVRPPPPLLPRALPFRRIDRVLLKIPISPAGTNHQRSGQKVISSNKDISPKKITFA